MSKNLQRLAERVHDDPSFLACAFSAYQRSSQADDQALATKLGCPLETLTPLRLCRMPASANPDFWRDVQMIATRFSIDADALAEIVRLGQSVVRLQSTPSLKDNPAGFLMAARDDEPNANSPDQGEPQ